VPIVFGGVAVEPGDVIVGDADGLVVVKAGEVDEAIRLSEARERKEAAMRERLRQGASMIELLGLQETVDRLGLE